MFKFKKIKHDTINSEHTETEHSTCKKKVFCVLQLYVFFNLIFLNPEKHFRWFWTTVTKPPLFALMIPRSEKNQNLPHVAETRRVCRVQNDTEKTLAY